MKNIELNYHVTKEIAKAFEAASYLWQREWAEQNVGNISLNISDIIGEFHPVFACLL